MLTHPSVDEDASQFPELDIGQTVSAEREGTAVPKVNFTCYFNSTKKLHNFTNNYHLKNGLIFEQFCNNSCYPMTMVPGPPGIQVRSVALGLGDVGVVADVTEVVEVEEALAATAAWCGFMMQTGAGRLSGGFIRFVFEGDKPSLAGGSAKET